MSRKEVNREHTSMMDNIRTLTTGVSKDLSSNMSKRLDALLVNVEEDERRRKDVSEYKSATLQREGGAPEKSSKGIMDFEREDIEQELVSEMEKILEANNRYYTLLRDYELMPSLVSKIVRVLQFLVSETLSPDIRTGGNYKHVLSGNYINDTIQKEMDDIRKELRLDKIVAKIVKDRYHVGHVYYRVVDYEETFKTVVDVLSKNNIINESASFDDILKCDGLEDDHISSIGLLNENYTIGPKSTEVDFTDVDLDIDIEFSSMYEKTESFKNYLNEQKLGLDPFSDKYGSILNESIFSDDDRSILNESVVTFGNNISYQDETEKKIEKVSRDLLKGKLNRCSVEKLDPGKMFVIKASGRIAGYFYMKNKDAKQEDVIKQRLTKSKAKSGTKNMYNETKRKVISTLAKNLIDTTKDKTGLSVIENVDLIHDYIANSGLLDGGKKLIFYRPDEIFDFSRTDGSILIDAVYNTKLYASLRNNNISTKILKGRGRTIYTVNMGASNVPSKYINNAINSLAAPESRIASFSAPFDRILNPYNSASDIIIPSEGGTDPVITADIIDGQRVDQDEETLTELETSIINSFGLDSAVIDTTNGNVDYARTLTMISKQIATQCRGEQDEINPELERFINKIDSISIPGYRELVSAGKVEVYMYRPKSLELTMSQDELGAAVSFANSVADADPYISVMDNDLYRNMFIYEIVKDYVNIDLDKFQRRHHDLLQDSNFLALKIELDKAVAEAVEKKRIEMVGKQEEVIPEDDGNDFMDDE